MAEVTEALSGETPVACGASCACGTGQIDEGRREFLKQSAAGLALLALAACGLGTATAPGSLSATTIQLSSEPALANVGGVATMQIGGSPVAVVRESATSFSSVLAHLSARRQHRAIDRSAGLSLSGPRRALRPLRPVDRRTADEQSAFVPGHVRCGCWHADDRRLSHSKTSIFQCRRPIDPKFTSFTNVTSVTSSTRSASRRAASCPARVATSCGRAFLRRPPRWWA